MTIENNGEEKKDLSPTPTPELNEDGTPKVPVEEKKEEPQNIDYKKKLEDEKGKEGDTKPAPKPKKSELEKAIFTAKSTAKRIKELGGDPHEIFGDDDQEDPDPTPTPTEDKDEDTYATKEDLARIEAEKLTDNPDEINLILHYVKKNGVSVRQAHLLANEGKLPVISKEINRIKTTPPANSGGQGGQDTPNKKVTRLNEKDEKRLEKLGMKFNPNTNAYEGTRTRTRFDGTKWISERKEGSNWITIPDASKFD